MAISQKTSTRFIVFMFFVITATIQAQGTVTRLQLESTPSLNAGEPQSDRAGLRWAWRSDTEILMATLASSTTKLSGNFLKHRMSANGDALLALERRRPKSASAEESELALHWFDHVGQSLGIRALAWHNDSPLPQFLLNHNGSRALLLDPASARATFLQHSSSNTHESFLFEAAPYTNERPAFLAASENYFYVLSQFAPTTTQHAQAPVLICYSRDGQEQWRRELLPGTAGHLAISPSGKWLVASRYETIAGRVAATFTLFEADGRQHATFSGLFREFAFSTDEQLLIALDRRQLQCVNIASGATLWQNQLQGRGEMYVTVSAMSPSYIVLVATSAFEEGRFIFKNARLLSIAGNGRQQFELAVVPTLIKPTIVVAYDNQHLLLAAEGLLQRYKITTASQSQWE